MAPKKKSINAYSVYIKEKQQELSKQGIKKSLKEISVSYKDDWEKMSDEKKLQFKEKSKIMNDKTIVAKYTPPDEKVEAVIKKSEECILQNNSMYEYIEKLVHLGTTAGHNLSKHNIIIIHINAYTCDKVGYYFPAEISMAEFSLEKGLIRIFHQIIGFDKQKANPPLASSADINDHALYNHQISLFPKQNSKWSINYTDVLLKIIGFIMNKDVDEAVLNDFTLNLPPIYTAYSSIKNELMITVTSLYQLYKSVVSHGCKDDFNNLLKVYHLDKLLMELKNVSYKIGLPKRDEKAIPSVAMATEFLSGYMLDKIDSIGCSFHEKIDLTDVCSNYYVCKWIFIFSKHCCQYFDIKLIAGCHYNFDLSKKVAPVKENFDNLNITNKNETYYLTEKKTQNLTNNPFPALKSGSSTIQSSVWIKPKKKINSDCTAVLDISKFPQLGNLQITTTETQNYNADGQNENPLGKK